MTQFPSAPILRTLASHESADTIATLLCAVLDYIEKRQYFDVTESPEFDLAKRTCEAGQEPYVSRRQQRMVAV